MHRLRAASPVTAVLLGTLGLALLAAWVPLTYLTGDVQVSRDGAAVVLAVGTGLLGLLVARRQPGNPEGWLLLGLAVSFIAVVDSGLYAVLDYRMPHGRLPLGETAVFIRGGIGPPLLFVFALVILLFPDGRLPRRWTWVLWLYLAVAVVATVGLAAGEAGSIAGQHIQVDVNEDYTGPGSPTGVLGVLANITAPVFFVVPLFWPAFVARQVFSWRRSAGDRRQRLEMADGWGGHRARRRHADRLRPADDQLSGRVARDLAFVALGALPVSIGVGILKYRLYEIDRIISRTLAYAVVTGLLVGVYAGLVLLATQVVRVPTPVAVAGSTLAAAALFNPVRRRVQHRGPAV